MAGHFAFLSFWAKGEKKILDPAWDVWRGPDAEGGSRKHKEMESEEWCRKCRPIMTSRPDGIEASSRLAVSE